MNHENEADETLYDLERNDYMELQLIADDADFRKMPLEEYIKKHEGAEDVTISADNFCSKFVSILKDLNDCKLQMSLVKAELEAFHNKMEIVMEKLK